MMKFKADPTWSSPSLATWSRSKPPQIEFTTLIPLREVQHFILDELARIKPVTVMRISKYQYHRILPDLYRTFIIPWDKPEKALYGTRPITCTKRLALSYVQTLYVGADPRENRVPLPINRGWWADRGLVEFVWALLKFSAFNRPTKTNGKKSYLLPRLESIHIASAVCAQRINELAPHTATSYDDGTPLPPMGDQSYLLWNLFFRLTPTPSACRISIHAPISSKEPEWPSSIDSMTFIGHLADRRQFSVHFHQLDQEGLRDRYLDKPHKVIRFKVCGRRHAGLDNLVLQTAFRDHVFNFSPDTRWDILDSRLEGLLNGSWIHGHGRVMYPDTEEWDYRKRYQIRLFTYGGTVKQKKYDNYKVPAWFDWDNFRSYIDRMQAEKQREQLESERVAKQLRRLDVLERIKYDLQYRRKYITVKRRCTW